MSSTPVITLTTDFGAASPYVAAMKGVILSINPDARILDLSHVIPPQDIRHAAYFLAGCTGYFPAGTIHVCVVDPGVGSDRAGLLAAAGGRYFLGPDNGVFTRVLRASAGATTCKLTNPKYWLPAVSNTFHGRDVFAPVAAHLSLGVSRHELAAEDLAPVELPTRTAVTYGGVWEGEVQFADDFGNLITNIPAAKLKTLPVKVSIAEQAARPIPWVRTYSEAGPGELVCLFSSDGFFEIADVNGNAARRLGVGPGAPVRVEPA
ncbi:MAG TPA: SAM-dependent chlorinase/fluorinase [Urbifossiella sp.]|jgi:hypothetical protein|nr:SAM-dependent chlorinase/fluorinase [Urbifossiella sp.]